MRQLDIIGDFKYERWLRSKITCLEGTLILHRLDYHSKVLGL